MTPLSTNRWIELYSKAQFENLFAQVNSMHIRKP